MPDDVRDRRAPAMDVAFRLHAVGPPLDRWVAGIWAVSGPGPVAAEIDVASHVVAFTLAGGLLGWLG